MELPLLKGKVAIPVRNQYMLDQAVYALCYTDYSWGGAAQISKSKTIENKMSHKLAIIMPMT